VPLIGFRFVSSGGASVRKARSRLVRGLAPGLPCAPRPSRGGQAPALVRLAASFARAFPLAGKKAADLDTALGYFERNAHRMRYAHFKKLGMFVGSGAVEAGCKSIAGQRCKLSGMRWTVAGATGILTLRCLEASDRWEEIPAPHSQTPAA